MVKWNTKYILFSQKTEMSNSKKKELRGQIENNQKDDRHKLNPIKIILNVNRVNIPKKEKELLR